MSATNYEFKKLSDVEVVAEPTESANVLIEENGIIKRVPKKEVGGGVEVTNTAEIGQTLIVKSIDENGMPSEWETVNFDNLVQAVLTNLGIEKINQKETTYLELLRAYYDDEGNEYSWSRYQSIFSEVNAGDILICTKQVDGSEVGTASYTFPEKDESGVFIGAEHVSGGTDGDIYDLYADFSSLDYNGHSLIAKMTLYYNSLNSLYGIDISISDSVGAPNEDLTIFSFKVEKDMEFLTIPYNTQLKDENGYLYGITPLGNDK